MNTTVNLETKQLLFDKGWKYELGFDETGRKVKNSLAEQRWNEGDLTYVDITIAEVLMWLYKKHDVWIGVTRYKDHGDDVNDPYYFTPDYGRHIYKTPTKAYEARIKFTLENLIK